MVMVADQELDDEFDGEDAVRINLRFNQAQLAAWNAGEPYIGLCFGIRGGKTYFGRNWILRQAVTFPKAEYICTANSYDQLRIVTVPNLKAALTDWGLPYRHVKGDRVFEVYIDRRTVLIHYRSMDNFDLTRGAEFGAAWMDELRDTRKEALEMMKGRLSSPDVDIGRLLCTTTPNGFDAFYEEFARRAIPGTHWFGRSRTKDNPFLRPNYVAQIYAAYDPQRAAQELDADFLVLGAGKVFSSFSRQRNCQGNAYDPKLPLWICVDFNIGAMGWVLAQITGSGEIHAVDELYPRNCTVPEMCRVLADGGNVGFGRMSPAWAKLHKAPWHITGDATDGRNRETGKSDWVVLLEHLRANGINPEVHKPNVNPAVKDRINSANAGFINALGQCRVHVNPACRELLTDLEQNTWKNGDVDKRDKLRTHCAEAFSYLIHQKMPSTGPTLFEGTDLHAA
jgi:Terminase large subunit, T4likevirus-type, N-terminal